MQIKKLPTLVLPAMLISVNLMLASPVTAQSFTTLYNFPPANGQNAGGYPTNSEGANPQAGLIVSGNKLYGTATAGGAAGWGTVFAVDTYGTGFAVLHEFTAGNRNSSGYLTNSDGLQPAGLVLSSNRLYGITQQGGSWGFGTVFGVNTDRTGFINLHDFAAGDDGANPQAPLILSGNTLYGTTVGEASLGAAGSDYGTVFALHNDGTGFTNLHNFTAPHTITGVNGDGAAPSGGLVLLSNVLYGTASRGGTMAVGTVFAVKTDGTGFTNLHNFLQTDGCSPKSGLILSGTTLYGTASCGGDHSAGTIFGLNIDGTGFAILHHFAQFSWTSEGMVNSDGYSPNAPLLLLGDTLYGTAAYGGNSGRGTAFSMKTDGTGFTNLHTFTALSTYLPPAVSSNLDGAHPGGGLIASGNTLYGTANAGGSSGRGTIFNIAFPPELRIMRSGVNVILTWSANSAGFDYSGFVLQCASNLDSPVWTANFPAPLIISGRSTVTNLISGRQQFYRLSQ
jgi:uncharacterized repeat protein (TIGR03803 family)